MPIIYPAQAVGQDTERSLAMAMRHGFVKRCPRCGKARIFGRYLKVNDFCANCGLELQLQRADDAPPYFTILIVGHIVLPGLLLLQAEAEPPAWMQYSLWLPLALFLTLWLLPRVKGTLIGFQWARGMHGFGDPPDSDDRHVLPNADAGHHVAPGAG